VCGLVLGSKFEWGLPKLVTMGRFVAVCSLIALVAAEELKIEYVTTNECEVKSKNGDQLSMHYSGWLDEERKGPKFDSSLDRGQTFDFQIGVGQVIKGWDEGLLDMCPGDERKLTIPADKGYGDQGAGDVIPGGATLYFDVKLISIGEAPAQVNIFKAIDKDNDSKLTKEEVLEYIEEQLPADQRTDEQNPEAITDEIFDHEDKDKDGVISHEEFSGPKHDEL